MSYSMQKRERTGASPPPSRRLGNICRYSSLAQFTRKSDQSRHFRTTPPSWQSSCVMPAHSSSATVRLWPP